MTEYKNGLLEEYKEYICGKTCAVLGFGISNIPLVRFLLKLGAKVTVRDKKTKDELLALSEKEVSEMEKAGVRFILGAEYLLGLSEQIIFKTPGLRYDKPEILSAIEAGSVLTSEMETFLCLCQAKIIAISGSDGKTTTTTLVSEMLKKEGKKVYLGGNIGAPLLSEIEKITPADFVVVELSSFQLHTVNRFSFDNKFCKIRFPDVAIITNVSPNHLDWHTDFEEYADSKRALYRYIREGGKLVTNAECRKTLDFAQEAQTLGIDTEYFSSANEVKRGCFLKDGIIYRADKNGVCKVLDREDILLPGIHNVENYMAAISAVRDFVSDESIEYVAKNFGGVAHRMEFVREINGVRYYNSSIDSSPTRTLAAIRSFPAKYDKRLVLIMGGYDKNIPFDALADDVCTRARAVLLCGNTKEKICAAIKKSVHYSEKTHIALFDGFDEAVRCAHAIAKDGDVVILTPACASFDLFRNFEERGNHYKELVLKL